ncbi:DUF3817 domain-containing protein [Reichenbachiella ulvae]|uniref:DUF3817 domain-containing protein n=1 Tax=Reichenbachiella ulvae TaxID=2980104 RepID=A0ABT3CQ82_9BACT|nr:DUF3817 domain-containing protein [Reichenbachiella ulvae]MCV9385772.1 DUF3817 domain-containing protein [Reichenbachiella ulvae]
MNLSTSIGKLRLLAILEGISYLLLGITMPLKYVMDIPEPNFIVGMAHGWLFILYIIFCLVCIYKYKWSFLSSALALFASLVPFGTFIADIRLFKLESVKVQEDQ